VLLSAGDRYEKLVERVKAGYGKFDDASARELMTRPVAMNSCISGGVVRARYAGFLGGECGLEERGESYAFTHYNLGS